MTATVRTAVFPVAGRGTRFLPATKAVPKELLPIVDKPLIQFSVDEALEAGANRLIFVTHSSKRAIEEHFDSDPELEELLADAGKQALLESVQGILPKDVSCIYVEQTEQLARVETLVEVIGPTRRAFLGLGDEPPGTVDALPASSPEQRLGEQQTR